MGYRLGLVLLAFVSQAASAKITAEVLMYKSMAHREADKGRTAEGAVSFSEVRIKRAQFQLDLRKQLFAKHAATAWDVSQGNLELAEANVSLGRAQAELITSRALERAWRLFAESAENGSDPAKDVAALIADSRKAQRDAAATCLENIKIISHEVNWQHDRGKILVGKSAISREELFNLEIAADEANSFVLTAQAELKKATAIFDEALMDLDALTRP